MRGHDRRHSDRCEHTEGHERLALHAAQDLLETAFIVELPGGNHGPVSQRSRTVASEMQWTPISVAEIWVMTHSFSSKDEGSGRPDTGLVMMQCSAAQYSAVQRSAAQRSAAGCAGARWRSGMARVDLVGGSYSRTCADGSCCGGGSARGGGGAEDVSGEVMMPWIFGRAQGLT